MSSFADIAKKKPAQTERPPLPPMGWYLTEVINSPEVKPRSSDKGNFEIVGFQLRGVEADDSVDLEELTKFGGAKGVIASKDFIFNNDDEVQFQRTEYDLRRFFENLGWSEADLEEKSYAQILAESKGRYIKVELGHRPDGRDGMEDVFYTDVKKTMKAD